MAEPHTTVVAGGLAGAGVSSVTVILGAQADALFLKLPAKGEWTFSQRVGNYKRRIDWRAPLATWICTNLLDPFEADGTHCKG